MKKILFVTAGLIGMAGLLFLVADNKIGMVMKAEVIVNSEHVPEYGFSYHYKDGYVVAHRDPQTEGDLVFVQAVFEQHEDQRFLKDKDLRIGPPLLLIEVFRNTNDLQLREWITKNDASNYQSSPDGTISTVILGDVQMMQYRVEGHYQTDAYAYAQDGYVYLLSNMWDNPQSSVKKDMEELLLTLGWHTPALSADE